LSQICNAVKLQSAGDGGDRREVEEFEQHQEARRHGLSMMALRATEFIDDDGDSGF
jgi:hypothetical protein